ncbi:MAG TPA: T9SS type A sorting domain-containing protein [Prolixibacteraceae bacterium]|nr:T9SS type A sorting domain-containing protein [Prolixibacteraceae bacterium]
MRKLYTKQKPIVRVFGLRGIKFWQGISLLFVLALVTSSALAQTEMTWTGAENNRFTNENNWNPAGSPTGNNLTIPMQTDSSLAPFVVEVSGSDNISVNGLEIVAATEDQYQPSVIINMDNDNVEFNVATGLPGGADYGYTGIIVKRGYYKFRKGNGPRLDGMNCWLRVEGGKAEFKNLLMGNANSPTSGGKIYISGGQVDATEGFGRIYTGREDGSVEIINDGILKVAGNFVSPTANWINGGTEFTIKRNYDAIANYTTFSAVPTATYIDIENTDRQVVKAQTSASDTLRLIRTAIVTGAATFTWRYKKQGESTYTNFAGAPNSPDFAPIFPTPGTYYVSCLVNGTPSESEVEFYVVSNAISFAPAEFSIQFVRLNETGTRMTAEFTTPPTQMEWKYATVPGGPYTSFSPAATSAAFKPSFTQAGNNYVVMVATINGEEHISTELLYSVEAATTTGKSLTWTGLVSDEGTNPANWTPVANPYKNTVYVNAFDSLSTLPYPVYSPVGNDTLSTVGIWAGSTFTVDIEDTLNIRGGWQQIQGTLEVLNGTITNLGFFRMDLAGGRVNLKGDSKLIVESLLLGNSNTPNNGGCIYLEDDAIMHCINLPGRVTPDTLEGVCYVSDNARIEYVGDQRTTVQGWIDIAKIVCPDEGWEPVVLYDSDNNLTIVKAQNTNAFSIGNSQKTYTTANIAIEEALTLVNVDGVTSWEWKWGTSVNGPWSSFEPAASNLPTYNPSFAASGTYYVVAETGDGTLTANMKPIVVIDLAISPAEAQAIDLNVDGTPLYTVIPPEFTVTAIAWYYSAEGSGEYFETGMSDTVYVPNFASKGVYYIFYGVEVQDEFGVQYFLQSSSVQITAGNVAVDELAQGKLKLYPNPTTGKFYVDGTFDRDYLLEILDLNGRVLYTKSCNAYSKDAIHFNTKGMYVVKLQSNQEVKVSRLVVK